MALEKYFIYNFIQVSDRIDDPYQIWVFFSFEEGRIMCTPGDSNRRYSRDISVSYIT